MKDELFAAQPYEWQDVPYTVNRHKWLLQWYREGDGNFGFVFDSPRGRRYSFSTERGKNGVRVTIADVVASKGKPLAIYWESWGDKPERMDAVLRLTPQHIIDRLRMLLDAIG